VQREKARTKDREHRSRGDSPPNGWTDREEDANDDWRLCNIRRILFSTATTFRTATAASAIGAILHRRGDAYIYGYILLLQLRRARFFGA
jgi:hypothetical protein